MNHPIGKGLRNDKKQSSKNLWKATKENGSYNPSFINNELSVSIRKLSASFQEKIQRESQINSPNKLSNSIPFNTSSILIEGNEIKLVFSKSQLNSYKKSLSKDNFLTLLLTPSNDFSLHFSLNHKHGQLEKLKDPSIDPLCSFASKDKMDLYDKGSLSKEHNSKGIEMSFYANTHEFPNNCPSLDFNGIHNNNTNRSHNHKVFSLKSLPVYINKKRGLSIDYSYSDSNSSSSNNKKIVRSIKKNNDKRYLNSHRKNESIKGKEKRFTCELCTNVFTSPQGLGGHMSRTHKDQSEKFKKKKEIRESRTSIRDLREEAKKIFCEQHHEDYNILILTKEGKSVIKKLIIQNDKEFKKIRENLRKKMN